MYITMKCDCQPLVAGGKTVSQLNKKFSKMKNHLKYQSSVTCYWVEKPSAGALKLPRRDVTI